MTIKPNFVDKRRNAIQLEEFEANEMTKKHRDGKKRFEYFNEGKKKAVAMDYDEGESGSEFLVKLN